MTVAYNCKDGGWRNINPMLFDDHWDFEHRGVLFDDGNPNPIPGALIPDVYYGLMARFTEPGWRVLDLMAGGMTGYRVGSKLSRKVTSVDIVCHGEPTRDEAYEHLTLCDAREYEPEELFDMVIWHPPYHDIVKFSDDPRCFGNAPDINHFCGLCLNMMARINSLFLSPNRMCAIVIGNIYKDGKVKPLPYMIHDIVDTFLYEHWDLKAWIVKNITGNRPGQENLWRYRCCMGDTVHFKTEHILVYRKLTRKEREKRYG